MKLCVSLTIAKLASTSMTGSSEIQVKIPRS
jgi:hypothetical protein